MKRFTAVLGLLLGGCVSPTSRVAPAPTVAHPTVDSGHPPPEHALGRNFGLSAFTGNKIGPEDIGLTAVDVRWSNYGVYLQRLIETVQVEWGRYLAAARIYPSAGSSVTVKFVMNSRGEITKILAVRPSAGTSDAAVLACVSGIVAHSPYEKWSADMRAALGEQQEMTISFYYR